MAKKHQFNSLTELSKTDLYSGLMGESDRGTVLITAEILSTALELLLKHVMPNNDDDLFTSNGPLENFSARINIAFAFGLISESVKHDLNLIRKIRNDFAHNITALTFDSSPVADRIKEFDDLNDVIKRDLGTPIPELDNTPFEGQRKPLGERIDTNRKRFMWEFVLLWNSIEDRGRDGRPFPTYEQWSEEFRQRHEEQQRKLVASLLGVDRSM